MATYASSTDHPGRLLVAAVDQAEDGEAGLVRVDQPVLGHAGRLVGQALGALVDEAGGAGADLDQEEGRVFESVVADVGVEGDHDVGLEVGVLAEIEVERSGDDEVLVARRRLEGEDKV